MGVTLQAFEVRLYLDETVLEPQADIVQARMPRVPLGCYLAVRVKFLRSGNLVDDLTGVVDATLLVSPADDPSVVFVTKTVLVADFSNPSGGSGAPDYHASFILTSADMMLALGTGTSREFNFVVRINLGSSNYVPAGRSLVTVFNDGSNTALPVIGSNRPNFRVTGDGELQLKNQTTGNWNTPWANGTDGNQQIALTDGEA